MGEPHMPIVDVDKEKAIHKFLKDHIKKAEAANNLRARELVTRRVKSRLTACTASIIALGTYFYAMYAVRQETFLDDFDEPEFETKSY